MEVIALSLLSLVPHDVVLRERCDVIETNDFRDDEGRTVFVQEIFYDWCPHRERWQVRAWRLVKCDHQRPEYDHARRLWSCTWLDGEVVRCITADSHRMSWTQYDPELLERDVLPKERRRELSHPNGTR